MYRDRKESFMRGVGTERGNKLAPRGHAARRRHIYAKQSTFESWLLPI